MNKSLTSILLVLLSISALSQNVTINGTAKGQADKLVRVIVYSDQFSKLEQTIAQTQTSNSGEFFLQTNIGRNRNRKSHEIWPFRSASSRPPNHLSRNDRYPHVVYGAGNVPPSTVLLFAYLSTR